MFRFAFCFTEQVEIVAAHRSCHGIDREPYSGIDSQIRQDFAHHQLIIPSNGTPRTLGRRQACVSTEGLAALRVTQEGDPLSGLTRILVDTCLPGRWPCDRVRVFYWPVVAACLRRRCDKGLSKNKLYKSRRRRISELAHFLLKMRCFADSPCL